MKALKSTDMKERTFEDFLKDVHASLYSMLLDDDMPDHFDNWLGQLDGEDYIRWANLFAKERFLAGMDHAINKFKN